MKRLFLLNVFLFSTFLLVAQNTDTVIVLSNAKELLNIGKQVFLFEDKEGNTTIEDIQKPVYQQQFRQSSQAIPNFGVTHSKIWVKFTIDNQTGKEIYLELANFSTGYIDFYKPNSLGKPLLSCQTGLLRPLKSREVDNNFFLFELATTSKPQTYYFSLQSEGTLSIPLTIGTTKKLFEESYPSILLLGMFSGLLFVMLCYNLVIYFSIRDKAYLYYCGYLFSGIFVSTFVSGNYNYQWNIISYFPQFTLFFLFVPNLFVSIFLLELLHIKRQALFFKTTVSYLILLFLLVFSSLFAKDLSWIVKGFNMGVLFFCFYLLLYSLYLYKKGNTNARFVVFGFSFFLLGTIIYISQLSGFIPINFFSCNAMVWGTSTEVFLFSLALGDRINSLQKEKEFSKNALLVQIQMNERLIREQNITLEQTITEKIKEIQEQNQELQTSAEELRQNLKELHTTRENLLYAQEKALFKSKFLEAIAKTNTYLLEENDWRDALRRGFLAIGKAIKVDRVYYFERVNNADSREIVVSQKIEWVAEGITPEINNPDLQNIPIRIFGDYSTKMLDNQIFSQNVAEITNNNFKDLLTQQGIFSIITIPLFVDGQFFGFLGFDDCKQVREISTEEVNILQTLAYNVAITIQHKLAEQRLIESQTKLQSVLNEVQDVIWAVRMPDFKMLLVTPSVVDIYGHSVAEWMQDSTIWQKAIHPDDQSIVATIFEDLANKGAFDYEYRIITTQGTTKWIRNKAKFILDEQQQVIRLDGIVVDITEQKEAENRLKLLQSLVDASTDAMQVASEDGTFFYLNNVAARRLGITQAEVQHYKVQKIEKLFEVEGTWEKHVTELKKLESLRVEGENINQVNGHCFPVEVSVNYVKIGNQGFVIANSRDITERKKIEAQLIKQQENLLRVGQIAKVGGWEYDVVLDKITWDKTIYDILELPYDFELTVSAIIGFYKEGSSRNKLVEAIEFALKEGIGYDLELQLITSTGKEIWARALGITECQNGICVKIFGVFQDITAHKIAEEQIKIKNEELQNYNKELQQTHQEIATLNNHLEILVALRTQKLTESNRKLHEYAFFNSHQLRAPIATILGLYELLKLNISLTEKEMIFEKIQVSIMLLNDMVKKSQSLLHEENEE